MKFSDEVIKILDNLAEKFGVVIDWTKDNIIPQLEEFSGRYIKYNIIKCGIGTGISFVFFLIATIILCRIIFVCVKGKQSIFTDRFGEISDAGIGFSVACGFALAITITLLMMCGSDLIKWIVIPEYQIITDIKYLIS